MFFRDDTLRATAVLFLLVLFILVIGLLVYALWSTPPREPPRRSRPVAVILDQETVTELKVYQSSGLGTVPKTVSSI